MFFFFPLKVFFSNLSEIEREIISKKLLTPKNHFKIQKLTIVLDNILPTYL
jgi:hypothetical protein